jgi:paired amphipathic helix protein Sin3a
MLYETDRLCEKTTPREQIVYRIRVEGIVGTDDHLHRFEWVQRLIVHADK